MATIATNLTNLSNARKDIINKLNNTLGSSIPQTTTLSNISPYINATNNSMVDFINMKRSYLKWSDAKQIATNDTLDKDNIRYVRYCDIDKDGFIIIYAWLQHVDGNWARILFCNNTRNKINQSLINDKKRFHDTVNQWIEVDASVTHNDWRGCTVRFTGWIKAGQQVAITTSKSYGTFHTHASLLYY